MKSLLIIMALCTSPSNCIPQEGKASVIVYERLVDCVRAKAQVPDAFEPQCTGKPFDPREQELG